MKKPMLCAALTVLILTSYSCTKETADKEYYMKLKVGGNWITYNNVYAENGPTRDNPSLYHFIVYGTSPDQKDVFTIIIQDDAPITASTTYHTDIFTYYTFMDWVFGVGTNNMRTFRVDDAPNMLPSKYTITISSITDKEITGSITGNYLYDFHTNIDHLREVTEGEFVAKRID